MFSSSLLTWENPVHTGALLAVLNFYLIMLVAQVPINGYLLSYGVLLAMALGLLAKITHVKVHEVSLSTVLPKDIVLGGADAMYDSLDSVLSSAVPVLLWENLQVSALVATGAYFFCSVLEYMSIDVMLLLAVNILFVYGKFGKEIDAAVLPHVEKARGQLRGVWSKVPRFQKGESSGSINSSMGSNSSKKGN